MTIPRELSPHECAQLIQDGGVGRLAFCTASGPQIYPLNFTADGKSIVLRTAPYGMLGTFGWGVDVAFEVDHLNWSTRQGWSVIIKGRAAIIEDVGEVDNLLEEGHDPRPWAKGTRNVFIRVPWREITGRVVGDEWLSSSPPASQGWNL
jgi:nitroimidazol reductase NimA-like FMN-containing flavoprotein (pyridoxamine 5'-phosphate oxidase superfamily)